MNFNQEKGVIYLSEQQLELMEQLPNEIKTIMLGCDTEFFQNKKESLEILKKLIKLNKDISVITKLSLSENFIREIKKIDDELNKNNNFLVFSTSLSSLCFSGIWEPGVPSPQKRIETLESAYKNGLKTLVALRPLLPTVDNNELERLVNLTKNFCFGYYSGPLYLKKLDLLTEKEKQDLNIEKIQPHWMPDDNLFYKIEKIGQMNLLKEIIKKNHKPFFDGAAEGIKYLKENEKHRT
jgi:DNA repair photolyase